VRCCWERVGEVLLRASRWGVVESEQVRCCWERAGEVLLRASRWGVVESEQVRCCWERVGEVLLRASRWGVVESKQVRCCWELCDYNRVWCVGKHVVGKFRDQQHPSDEDDVDAVCTVSWAVTLMMLSCCWVSKYVSDHSDSCCSTTHTWASSRTRLAVLDVQWPVVGCLWQYDR